MSYYFGIKPQEFWNSRYKEIDLYCEIQLIRLKEDFKQQIILQEAVTDKMLQGDCMLKKPKIKPLKNVFNKFFKDN